MHTLSAGVHGADVTITDVTIKPQIGNRTGDVIDVMPGSDGPRILEFEKNRVEIWAWTKKVDFRSSPRPDQLGLRNVPRVCWVSESRTDDVRTVIIVRNCVSLSSWRKNLKLKKVIKSFVPELISWFFGFLYAYNCVYEHLWTFSLSVWICIFHVFISWSYFWIFLDLYMLQYLSQWYKSVGVHNSITAIRNRWQRCHSQSL